MLFATVPSPLCLTKPMKSSQSGKSGYETAYFLGSTAAPCSCTVSKDFICSLLARSISSALVRQQQGTGARCRRLRRCAADKDVPTLVSYYYCASYTCTVRKLWSCTANLEVRFARHVANRPCGCHDAYLPLQRISLTLYNTAAVRTWYAYAMPGMTFENFNPKQ